MRREVTKKIIPESASTLGTNSRRGPTVQDTESCFPVAFYTMSHLTDPDSHQLQRLPHLDMPICPAGNLENPDVTMLTVMLARDPEPLATVPTRVRRKNILK